MHRYTGLVRPRLRLSKSQRLTRSSEFERVRAEGRSIRGELLTMGFLADASCDGYARAGFITSKRLGTAVMRNRTRRRLREIFRKHQHHITAGAWLVTIASPRAARASYQQLEEEWLRLARRAFILIH